MGYDVHVVVDASGAMNESVQQASIIRMTAAGATITNWFAVSCELLSDWRNETGPGSAQLFSDRLPDYADAITSYQAAKNDSED